MHLKHAGHGLLQRDSNILRTCGVVYREIHCSNYKVRSVTLKRLVMDGSMVCIHTFILGAVLFQFFTFGATSLMRGIQSVL